MRKFYEWIVEHTKTVLTAFLVLTVLSIFMKDLVEVDYDINDYLPEDAPSTVALDVMEEEFEGGIPNARVMINDLTIPQALEYKEKLKQVDGVSEVTWLDDAADIHVPLNTIDRDTLETYYKDNAALFTVTIDENKRIQAVEDIRALIGEDNAMTGSAVSTAVATTSTVKEVMMISAFAVLFVLIVLLITTPSWIEPLIVLGGLGVAIAINSGTNLIFGRISFVTNAAGNILQLAVSLDYSVFLIHRFEECRLENPDAKSAMVDALMKSTTSILSSGLTTVIGFLALVLMQFRIGPDLGLALAKGVALSLITVFVFMPDLILVTYRLLDKTRHRELVPSCRGLGKLVRRLMIPMVCVFLVIFIPAYLASNQNDYYYGASHIFGVQTQLGADTAEIEDVFGQNDTYVLMVPNNSTATEKELSDSLHELPQVTSIISYVDAAGAEIPLEYLDADTLAKLRSPNYSRMVISLDTDYEGKQTFQLVEQIRSIADSYYPGSYYLAGEGVSTYDLMDTITDDMLKVNALAIGAVFLVLLMLMKSISLPVILVLSIETAIWLNLAVPYFQGNTVFYISYLIISSVQLGATVDYAILLTDRYRECRQTMDKKESIVETISAVTVSILTSGSVMTVVGFLMGYISTHGLLAQLGKFLGIGTIFSMLIVLFVLPGMLYLLDRIFIGRKAHHHQNKKNKNQKEKQEVAVR